MKIVLEVDGEFENAIFMLRNLEGKQVKSIVLNNKTTEINLGDLSKGDYIYQVIQNEKKVAEGKLIKI